MKRFRMFSRSKSLTVTRGDPLFSVRYLGKQLPPDGSFSVNSENPVTRLWDSCKDKLKSLPKCELVLNCQGIEMRFGESRDNAPQTKTFRMVDIARCRASRDPPKLFIWIAYNTEDDCMEYHAVSCSSNDMASEMAIIMNNYFHMAWQNNRVRTSRHERYEIFRKSAIKESSLM
ncbi:uncharacterized protein LOC117106212 isoform X2 [Anneissia japonica]|uniref:uncharacterized protein LOC117106212 isoform X2 n=1 Tax=Anneissia japonica TaxID=1529436 RepID=UPI001425A6A4|nr:uncharacterized protein LOC117106212 isoform X2 [Anneissia japonica]